MKLYKYDKLNLKYQQVNYPVIFLKFTAVFFTLILFLGLANAPRDPEFITETEKILIALNKDYSYTEQEYQELIHS